MGRIFLFPTVRCVHILDKFSIYNCLYDRTCESSSVPFTSGKKSLQRPDFKTYSLTQHPHCRLEIYVFKMSPPALIAKSFFILMQINFFLLTMISGDSRRKFQIIFYKPEYEDKLQSENVIFNVHNPGNTARMTAPNQRFSELGLCR